MMTHKLCIISRNKKKFLIYLYISTIMWNKDIMGNRKNYKNVLIIKKKHLGAHKCITNFRNDRRETVENHYDII